MCDVLGRLLPLQVRTRRRAAPGGPCDGRAGAVRVRARPRINRIPARRQPSPRAPTAAGPDPSQHVRCPTVTAHPQGDGHPPRAGGGAGPAHQFVEEHGAHASVSVAGRSFVGFARTQVPSTPPPVGVTRRGGASGLPAPVTGLRIRTPPGNSCTDGISARACPRPLNCPVSGRTPAATRGRVSGGAGCGRWRRPGRATRGPRAVSDRTSGTRDGARSDRAPHHEGPVAPVPHFSSTKIGLWPACPEVSTSGISSQEWIPLVTSSGRSVPAATASRVGVMFGRACPLPLWKWTPRW